MKKNKLLLLILLLAFLLRVFKLGDIPATLYGDEQAFAWNAYNILKLGTDEYGTPYPLQFRSFDDYKAPIPVYLLVPFIKFFGLNAWGIRLPITLVSILTVVITFFLARLFFGNKISLLITFLLAISPWHIHLSRGYFEATLALLWFILGVYFFLKSGGKIKELIFSMIFFCLSLYSYFTPRILIPIFLVFLIWYGFYNSLHLGGAVKRHPRCVLTAYLLSIVLLVIVSLPLIHLSIFQSGFSRFTKLSETNKQIVEQTVNRERNASNLPVLWRTVFHNKATVWLRTVKNNYLEHLSPNFWYIYGDNSLRYFTGNMGMFYLLEFPFFLLGLYSLWKEKKKTALFFIGWLLLAPIPASVVGRSFAVRSLAMLPAPFVFVGYGIYKAYYFLNKIKFRMLYSMIISLLFVISIVTLLIKYYLEYPVYAATWWGWENKKALDYTKEREKDLDYIFLSDFYTGMPLAFAVYNQSDPIEFRDAVNNPITMADGRHLIKLGKYYIGSLDIDKERLEKKIIPPRSLYLGRPEEADSDENINAPDDGRIIFKIYQTDERGDLVGKEKV
jgi:4-amino-4-deoxy-L-arabinose transferase-like glycosyltransferase